MPKCSVAKCPNRSGQAGLTFHRFPHSRPEVLKKWIRNLNRYGFTPSKTSGLCSAHFEDHCFVRHPETKLTKLTKEAIPTLFFYPLHLRKLNSLGTPEKDIPSSLHLRRLNSLGTPKKDIPSSTQLPLDKSTSSSDKKACIESPSGGTSNTEKDRFLKEELIRLQERVHYYKKTLKTRQQNIRRLTHKTNSLNKKVKELEENGNLAKHADRVIKQYFSGAPLDIILGIIKPRGRVPCPPSLKLFALTFFRHSPKAYNFVYSAFQGGFPKPKTVRRWDLEDRRLRAAKIDDIISHTVADSPPEVNGDGCNSIQQENEDIQSSILESGNPIPNQHSVIESDNSTSETSEANPNEFVQKGFSSDLDELVKATLSISPPENNNNPESKGYYVVHLKNPNNEYSSEEQESILVEESCVVIVKTEETE